MKKLDCLVVEHNPNNQPICHAVIWLHGLGASGHDFEPIVPELGLNLPVRFIFPHAPSMPVTINGGYVMPAWYDIYERSLDRKVDVEQIVASSQAVDQLIDDEIAKGIPSQNIIIAGFSQGGAVAYQTVMASQRPLAGLLALSTYFATADQINRITISPDTAVRIDHGDFDEVVPAVLGFRAKQTLQDLGFNPTFTTYPMAHQVCMPQIRDIGHWMNGVFGA